MKARIIVAATIDMESVPGSCGGYHCSECNAEVQLAPTGQAFVATSSNARLVCIHCFLHKYGDEPDLTMCLLPGSVAEFRAFLRSKHGHRHRN